MNEDAQPVFGIACWEGHYAVCLWEAIVAENWSDYPLVNHPESRAQRDAAIALSVYLGEPVVLDVEFVVDLIDDGDAYRDWLAASTVEFPTILAGYVRANYDGAEDATRHWYGLGRRKSHPGTETQLYATGRSAGVGLVPCIMMLSERVGDSGQG